MSAVPALSEVPNLRDEIDRKAFMTLEKLAGQLESGKINEAMFDIGVRTVWDCVAGLASTFVMDTVEEVKELWIDGQHRDLRVLYQVGKPVVLLSRMLGQGSLTLRCLPDATVRDWDFGGDVNPARSARAMQDSVEQKFIARGYRRI